MKKEKLTNVDYESIDPYEFKAPYFVCMEHLARYIWAAYYLKRKRVNTVLDIACGCGYGSRELALGGFYVTGFDYDAANIEKANKEYYIEGMTEYITGDINSREYMELPGGRRFDSAVCFETLEHIKEPEIFLKDLHRLISKRGFLLISAPDGKYEPVDADGKIKSSYHLHAFPEARLEELLLSAGFQITGRMYQPDAAGLHRNEFRAIRDTEETRQTAELYYQKSPQAARFLCQVFAWPRKEKGESYSNIFICVKE